MSWSHVPPHPTPLALGLCSLMLVHGISSKACLVRHFCERTSSCALTLTLVAGSPMANPLFWLALVSQLIIVWGYFWFYRKEQLGVYPLL